MQFHTKIFVLIVFCHSLLTLQKALGQTILDPADVVVDTNAHRRQPEFGEMGKWERTQKVKWNSDSYKAYIYKGRQFRLKFPKTYDPKNGDKKYPVFVFFHGLGEKGDIYDNDYQLYNGGLIFSQAVDAGKFDGYLLYVQSKGFFGNTEYQLITEIIDYMVAHNKADPFRIYLDGLSAGGQAAWEMLIRHPDYATCVLPISNSSNAYTVKGVMDSIRFTPIWLFQGGKDISPSPYTTHIIRDALLSEGANLKYTEYPTLNHIAWDSAWVEPDFIPFMLRAYASNPWPLFGKTDFAPNELINDTIGVAPGFDQYQWKRDSMVIVGANKNILQVTQPGIYYARVLKGSIWSDWSHSPVTIKGTFHSDMTLKPAYPVPFRDYFIIPIPYNGMRNNIELTMFDLTGQIVFQQAYNDVGFGNNLVRVNPPKNLAKGFYLIKLVMGSADNTRFLKLVKQ